MNKEGNLTQNIFQKNINGKVENESKSRLKNMNENENENESTYVLSLLCSGASDLGGISPHDEVNPTYRFQKIQDIKLQLKANGYDLVERLPVYEHHFPNLSDRVKQVIDTNYENFYK